MIFDRRIFLKSAGALATLGASARFAYAATPSDRRLVVVVLRGALDGLAAVPAYGDKDYAGVRGDLALSKSATAPLQDLDGFFGLHPSLVNLKTLFDTRQLLVFHNICSPYRDRSHFDGQNVLEIGSAAPHVLQDGWLNRALRPLGLSGDAALAIAQTPPLILSGKLQAGSWMPPILPAPSEVFLRQVQALYQADPELQAALSSALALQASASRAMDDPSSKKGAAGKGAIHGDLTPLFEGAGRLLAAPGGPRIATLEASGWDTHVAQGAGDGQLARRLSSLDVAIAAMRGAMNPDAWKRTAIVMVTEFGRTAHPNGSGGTDHGTGSAAFLFGGAVAGGTVRAEWTGLGAGALRDGRDLPARTDLRALFKGLLAEHLGISRSVLESEIFPDSMPAAPITGLIRA